MPEGLHAPLTLVLLVVCALVCLWLFRKSRQLRSDLAHRIQPLKAPEKNPPQQDKTAVYTQLLETGMPQTQVSALIELLESSRRAPLPDTLSLYNTLLSAGFPAAQAKALTYILHEYTRSNPASPHTSPSFRGASAPKHTEKPAEPGLRLWLGLLFLAQTVILLCVLRAFTGQN